MQSTAWSKTYKWIKEIIGGCFYFYSISLLPLICGRIASPFWVGKLSYIHIHAKAIQREDRDLHQPWNTIYRIRGHAPIWAIEGKRQLSWCGGPHHQQALQIDPPTLSPSSISASMRIRFSPFSQPSLPAPYFSGSKQDGLRWRAPCNLSLTISIWQLLWIPAAEWKGQKPWLCWGVGAPGETYVNKAQLCSLLHLSLFFHSCLDLRWN